MNTSFLLSNLIVKFISSSKYKNEFCYGPNSIHVDDIFFLYFFFFSLI